MFSKGIYLHVLILFIFGKRYCESLANHAVYTIENRGSKQCLSAGGVMRNFNDTSITLFKQGRVMSKPCSDINAINTTDFSQQWMIRIQRENPRNLSYQVQLEMLNTLYYDAKLTAELRGEFIMYFPDTINLKAQHPADEISHSQEFFIFDPTTEKCLHDRVEEHRIQFVKCSESEDFQKWNFTLVSEKLNFYDTLNMSMPTQAH